ncbi:Flp family type IVb pilin [Alkalibacillus haloalkaliphilus]|uniref:Flp family type IVb pilin n=1 Tax=Alkalibacillus haloalkaliphilus TaxID=94136 RepID=UPI002936715B|nr:Flp family type IVb pilin [Alkalibacillus haloalkaliphilus]MDV2580756.1 Flp family type IVb pilin [Alkalibacillus haloalkaliphilus]
MLEKFKALLVEEEGQGMVEYGLIIGLVSVVIVGALVTMQGGLESIFESISNILNDPESAS